MRVLCPALVSIIIHWSLFTGLTQNNATNAESLDKSPQRIPKTEARNDVQRSSDQIYKRQRPPAPPQPTLARTYNYQPANQVEDDVQVVAAPVVKSEPTEASQATNHQESNQAVAMYDDGSQYSQNETMMEQYDDNYEGAGYEDPYMDQGYAGGAGNVNQKSSGAGKYANKLFKYNDYGEED